MKNGVTSRRGPSYSSLFIDQTFDETNDQLAGYNKYVDNRASFTYYDGNFEIDGGNDEKASRDTTNASVPNHG